MRSADRRGIEIAAGTVVMLIIAVAVLAMAVTLTWRVTCGADEYRVSIDSQSEQQIERLLSSGGSIVVADNSKTAQLQGSALCGSSSQRSATFTLGIRNTESVLGSLPYYVVILDSDQNPATNVRILADESHPAEGVYELGNVDPGERISVPILVLSPASGTPGVHEYTVQVRQGEYSPGNPMTGLKGVRTLYLRVE